MPAIRLLAMRRQSGELDAGLARATTRLAWGVKAETNSA